MPDGLDGLTRFTMTVIDLATGKPHAPDPRPWYARSKQDGTLDTMQVTTTEVDLEALEKQHKEGTRGERVRQYVTPPSVNPGMFFVPR